MVRKARLLLIRFAKAFPFILCAILWISYAENIIALAIYDYATFGDSFMLYKPISWFIGDYFTYDWHTIIVTIVLSIAFETCIWNKLGILYLCANLYEREYFENNETACLVIALVSVANIIVSSYLIYKGFKTLK